MMKKKLLAAFLSLFAPAAQAVPIDSLFAAAPESVLPLLDLGNRLDLLDLSNARMRAEVSNAYDGQTLLTEKTERHLRLQLTAASTWDLILLPERADTVLVVLRSFATPAVTSRLLFYTPQWKPLSRPVPACRPEDFYAPSGGADGNLREDLLSKLRPAHVEMLWDEQSGRLQLRLSTAGLTAEDRAAVAPLLRPLWHEWRDGRFQRVAQAEE